MPPKKKLDEPRVTKQFILDHLEENEVDLSMCGLSKVPVRELVRNGLVPSGHGDTLLTSPPSCRQWYREEPDLMSPGISSPLCLCVGICYHFSLCSINNPKLVTGLLCKQQR